MAKQFTDRGKDDLWEPNQIKQDTLIIWGEHDSWIPIASGRTLAGQMPNARFVLVPSAGHLPLEEQPDFCNRELLRFLNPETELAPDQSSDEASAEPQQAQA